MRKSLTLIALALVAGAHATVVYDNITDQAFKYYAPTAETWADDTILSRSDLAIESATFLFYAPKAYSGVGLNVGLWSDLTGKGTQIAAKSVVFDIAEANVYTINVVFDHPVVVPNKNIWTSWQFTGVNGEYGLLWDTPTAPTIGSSNNYFGSIGSTGDWGIWWYGADYNCNYGVKLNAVPEPASIIAIGAGLAALAARRRRK